MPSRPRYCSLSRCALVTFIVCRTLRSVTSDSDNLEGKKAIHCSIVDTSNASTRQSFEPPDLYCHLFVVT